MCANLFPLICNSSPDSDPPRAEENDRTRTVETADGLSRRAQSGVRCALLHASAHSVHAQKYTAHTTQSPASTSERDDSTRHIMERTRIASLEPHNAHAARESDAPVSLQYERQLYPGGPAHKRPTSGAHASPDTTPRQHHTSTKSTPRWPTLTAHSSTRPSAQHTTTHQPLRCANASATVKPTPPQKAHQPKGGTQHSSPRHTRHSAQAPALIPA